MNETPEIAQERRSDLEPGYPTYQTSRACDVSGADTDEQLITMWLAGRPANTVRAYSTDIGRLRNHVLKPIRRMSAKDLIDWTDTIGRLKPASQYRILSAVKSLFSFAHRLGYLTLDPAAALRMPRVSDDRASKLLPLAAVQRVLKATTGRDRLILRTLYLVGLRESELVSLDTSDIRETGQGFSLSVTGKGGKSRTLAIPTRLARELLAHGSDGPLFVSRTGKRLDVSTVYRIVTAAGQSVGVKLSPHKLRHAHASHSLDNGAPLHVLRDSLGHSSLATTSIYSHAKPEDSSALYLSSDTADELT